MKSLDRSGALFPTTLDEDLLHIRNLADTQQRGSLDLTDFIIGMYLIQSCMADPSMNLPATLPPGTYEQASGGRLPPVVPMSPQRTGSSLRPQHTGPISPMNPQRTGTPTRAPSVLTGAPSWDVTAEAKASSDRFFAQLDTQNKGIIEGDVAVPFMLQSQLDEGTLATIWDLADIKHEGRLDRDQFAVAMHLINAKLAGRDVPNTLPISLIPPSLRQMAGTQEAVSGPSDATRDLFDLFDDPPASTPVFTPAPPRATFSPVPPAPAFAPRIAPPAARSLVTSPPPPSDLLGEEAAPVSDHSAEIGNKRNELESTEKNLAAVSSTRQQLETTASDSATQLADLQQRLSTAREKHETETKAIADLNQRVSEQKATLQKLNSELITAESDVSALKSEKSELEQSLLHDKEEVRDLQRRMKDLEEERTNLKTVLEKLRKEARQRKGMVTIAKKQLSTAETARDGVQTEIDAEASAASAAAAAVPLPATPQALSPVATGVSQRSNNPFDRLGRSSQSSTAALVGAGAAAAAGAVVAGAETLPHAAKEAVSPPVEEEKGADDTDNAQATVSRSEDDPFEVSANEEPETRVNPISEPVDAFGAGISTEGEAKANGFGDSFASPPVDSTTADSMSPPQPAATGTAESDFDAAFVDFDGNNQIAPTSEPRPVESNDAASSDEEEEPEDIDAPSKYRAMSPPVGSEDVASLTSAASISAPSRSKSPGLAPPLETPATITPRRSAPPPPVRNTSTNIDALDPFAPSSPQRPTQTTSPETIEAPLPSTSPTVPTNDVVATSNPAPAPSRGAFDDDDFDFSDLPAATVDNTSKHPTGPGPNFDDEFAGFDDEFGSSQPPSGSDNSNLAKSYEMVSPAPRGYDEWAVPGTSAVQAGQSSLSFDDAFGGDFE